MWRRCDAVLRFLRSTQSCRSSHCGLSQVVDPTVAARRMEVMLTKFQQSFQEQPAAPLSEKTIHTTSEKVLGVARAGGFATEAWEVFIALSSTGVEVTQPLKRLTADTIAAASSLSSSSSPLSGGESAKVKQQMRAIHQLMAAERPCCSFHEDNDVAGKDGGDGCSSSSSDGFSARLVQEERLLLEAGLDGSEEEFRLQLSKLLLILHSSRSEHASSVVSSLWWRRRIAYALLLNPRRSTNAELTTASSQLKALLLRLRALPLCSQSIYSDLRRTAECDTQLLTQAMADLLIPRQAHNVLHSPSLSTKPSLQHETPAKESHYEHLIRYCSYVLPFGHSVHRLHDLLRRRRFSNLLIPDAAFLLSHTSQLKELSRAREVIITHQVLLQLLHVAEGGDIYSPPHAGRWWKQTMPFSGACSPLRFSARRLLCTLLSRAGPRAVEMRSEKERAECRTAPPKRRHHSRRRSLSSFPEEERTAHGDLTAAVQRCTDLSLDTAAESDGVTVLGLCDEIELHARVLSYSRHFFFFRKQTQKDSYHREKDALLMTALGLEEVLAADKKQERRWKKSLFLASSSSSSCEQPLLSAFEEDSRCVDSVLLNPSFESRVMTSSSDHSLPMTAERKLYGRGGERHSHPRATRYWARQPVVVVTTQEPTRELAYHLGIQTYPPTTSIVSNVTQWRHPQVS